MADSTPSHVQEKTFSSFNKAQGANYHQARRDYHPTLYKILLDHHKSTGGGFNSILDIGCGPGTAVRTLAAHFDHAIGLDPSDGMIETARSLGGVTKAGAEIRFEISNADNLGTELPNPVQDASVDLIVAATCAHWFDMSAFWPRAAQVLRPGGTVAIWCSSSLKPHPDTPNAERITQALEEFQAGLEEYYLPGNRITRDLLRTLGLPWTIPNPVETFEEASFRRQEWGTDEKSLPTDEYYNIRQDLSLASVEMVLGTASPVIRWREAHPEKAGTKEDVVKIVLNKIEKALRDAGVEFGKELVKGGVMGVLLLVKKKA
ncbi:S-adenosyl-L-methionine-dependent methyltransferase [Lophiotrema nucula]|uniref:S-adenosyl-L-methionine-dependent methyltransferase n=1 Tax=Lophiotrema nucula TaxID=690887 RepID=A0A6A5Z219_9PLEO|nr:S-adenosyl-L-methionine-dependent methyltransferase [Lophiotrema nucula]